MAKDKKRAAALSAVIAYMKNEEQQRIEAGPIPPAGSPSVSVWGLSGRQAQMQLRSLMQLRAFSGFRLR